MPSKKTKKSGESVGTQLALVIKSGKYCMGYKQSLKALRNKDAKLIIIAKNCPPLRRAELEYMAFLARPCLVHRFGGDNNLLGTACRKLYRSSVVAVMDEGDSDILDHVKTSKA